jgi:hypothetical protein
MPIIINIIIKIYGKFIIRLIYFFTNIFYTYK